jgi:hypothetical protein
VAALERAVLPRFVEVDCGAGQSLGDTLASLAQAVGRLSVTIRGFCQGGVLISRDDVTLQGVPDASSAGVVGGISVDAARRVSINELTIRPATGNVFGLSLMRGADVRLWKGTLEGVAINVTDSSIEIASSTIHNTAAPGVTVKKGLVRMFDSTVDTSSSNGIDAWQDSVVEINSSAVTHHSGAGISVDWNAIVRLGGTEAAPSRIADNATGLAAGAGSLIDVLGVVLVERSNGHGIFVEEGSILRVRNAGGQPAGPVISGSRLDGVSLHDTSVASIGGTTQIKNNAGWGIRCAPAPAVAQLAGREEDLTSVVFGNTAGQVSCPPHSPF